MDPALKRENKILSDREEIYNINKSFLEQINPRDTSYAAQLERKDATDSD